MPGISKLSSNLEWHVISDLKKQIDSDGGCCSNSKVSKSLFDDLEFVEYKLE